jgi:hypothetical protein
MSTVDTAKNIGRIALGVGAFVGFMAIPIAFLYGAAMASLWVLKYSPIVLGWTLTITLLILTPLALVPQSRSIAGIGFFISSVVFGLILWLYAIAYTFVEWGLLPLIIGILLGGVGVVPIAFVLSIFDAAWSVLGTIGLMTVLAFGSQALGIWLIEKAADRQFAMEAERARREIVVPAKRID